MLSLPLASWKGVAGGPQCKHWRRYQRKHLFYAFSRCVRSPPYKMSSTPLYKNKRSTERNDEKGRKITKDSTRTQRTHTHTEETSNRTGGWKCQQRCAAQHQHKRRGGRGGRGGGNSKEGEREDQVQSIQPHKVTDTDREEKEGSSERKWRERKPGDMQARRQQHTHTRARAPRTDANALFKLLNSAPSHLRIVSHTRQEATNGKSFYDKRGYRYMPPSFICLASPRIVPYSLRCILALPRRTPLSWQL